MSRGRAVEEVQVQRSVLDPVAQHLDGAALDDLALQPRQERPPRGTALGQRQRLGRRRLGGAQERRELRQVDAVLTVVVVEVAAAPAHAAGARGRIGHRALGRPMSEIPRQLSVINRSSPRSEVPLTLMGYESLRLDKRGSGRL